MATAFGIRGLCQVKRYRPRLFFYAGSRPYNYEIRYVALCPSIRSLQDTLRRIRYCVHGPAMKNSKSSTKLAVTTKSFLTAATRIAALSPTGHLYSQILQPVHNRYSTCGRNSPGPVCLSPIAPHSTGQASRHITHMSPPYKALKVANELALSFSAELLLVHVRPHPCWPPAILATPGFDMQPSERQLAENARQSQG
jgi:hypothetical protein